MARIPNVYKRAVVQVFAWLYEHAFTVAAELAGCVLLIVFADYYGSRWAVLTAALIALAVGISREVFRKGSS